MLITGIVILGVGDIALACVFFVLSVAAAAIAWRAWKRGEY
jgi:hypothetical protein